MAGIPTRDNLQDYMQTSYAITDRAEYQLLTRSLNTAREQIEVFCGLDMLFVGRSVREYTVRKYGRFLFTHLFHVASDNPITIHFDRGRTGEFSEEITDAIPSVTGLRRPYTSKFERQRGKYFDVGAYRVNTQFGYDSVRNEELPDDLYHAWLVQAAVVFSSRVRMGGAGAPHMSPMGPAINFELDYSVREICIKHMNRPLMTGGL